MEAPAPVCRSWRVVCLTCVSLVTVAACRGSTEQPTTIPSRIDVPASVTDIPSSVVITVGKARYSKGEEIQFRVTNHLEQTIYYSYGCDWPNPFKLEAGERIGLAWSTDLNYPRTKQIAPSESHNCLWDQIAWQDPTQTGLLRFQSYMSAELVPSGQYELGFFYYLDEAEVGYGDDHAIAIWSGPFYIE